MKVQKETDYPPISMIFRYVLRFNISNFFLHINIYAEIFTKNCRYETLNSGYIYACVSAYASIGCQAPWSGRIK